ncbi:alpha/beta hydrolase family protein [Microbacterium sp. SA39]|uniref:alpha/beta hydrolase family protein n=1 Tax=Microbacterium sp. SA39 TaxID=1263625 RepID=UPI0005F9D631|nr:alpha/beta fold hydrolase [Microbacterium sp. SA39]KJQ54707.1 Alpha/beta hydrolase family protein [Microbacterium sp. SA39]
MKSLRHAVALLVPALLALGATLSFLVFGVARRVVTPMRRPVDTRILAIDTGAQTIELERTDDTELPGRYGLFTTGTYGYVKIGAVLSADATSVRRKLLTKIETGARVDGGASFSGYYYASPSELHLSWQNIVIGSPAGPCPAWFFPAESSTWVIQVHGRGATRVECLRAVPVLHAAGFPNLVVSYRNDGEAPRSRSGGYALGTSEWRDLDAAIAYALRHGAERVVLMGWSMGGAVVLQAAVSSSHRERIVGLILESPVVDWRTVLRYQARKAGVRAPLPDLAMSALQRPLMARISGADDAISFDRLDMVTRAAELRAPMLILHSADDGFVPIASSLALAQARPDLVTMPEFGIARHTKIWNYDQNGWSAAITEWLQDQGFSASA